MIEDRCTKGVNPRDWSFDSSGKALFSDLRNSLIDLVTRHLAFRFVANAGAADAELMKFSINFGGRNAAKNATSCCAEQGHDAADAHVDVNGAGTFLDPDNCRTMIAPYR